MNQDHWTCNYTRVYPDVSPCVTLTCQELRFCRTLMSLRVSQTCFSKLCKITACIDHQFTMFLMSELEPLGPQCSDLPTLHRQFAPWAGWDMGNLGWLVSFECLDREMMVEIRSYAAVVSFRFVLLKPLRLTETRYCSNCINQHLPYKPTFTDRVYSIFRLPVNYDSRQYQ